MSLFDDTHPDAERVYLRLLSQAPVWRKMEIVDQLYAMAVSLGRAGIRRRHPQADDEEVRLRLARLLLGNDLATRVYGPMKGETDADQHPS
jgi:hypothetical protein